MHEKTCCVTGHREIPEDKRAYVEAKLQKAVDSAVKEGYTRFLSGFAAGVDLAFAAIVAERKAQGCPLTLEAVIPYAGRLKSKDPAFQRLLAACDEVNLLCNAYSPSCYFLRNRRMVDESSLVIAVYNGQGSGGTFYTIDYARTQNKEVRMITI